VAHTYSWGNTANTRGWNKDQPEDVSAAKQALAEGTAWWRGDATLDPFIDLEFDRLNKAENEHFNGGITYNCKSEAGGLIQKAIMLRAGY
jgi:hypothetical protein